MLIEEKQKAMVRMRESAHVVRCTWLHTIPTIYNFMQWTMVYGCKWIWINYGLVFVFFVNEQTNYNLFKQNFIKVLCKFVIIKNNFIQKPNKIYPTVLRLSINNFNTCHKSVSMIYFNYEFN